MYEVVICSVHTGRVERKPFATWEAARAHADKVTEKRGRNVRVWLDRVNDTPTVQPMTAQPMTARIAPTTGRSFAA